MPRRHRDLLPRSQDVRPADLDQGSLAYGVIKKESRIFKIPNELSDEEAAPLVCAGATVFNVLDTYGAKPTDCVGVVDIGGLGHLAVQVCQRECALCDTGELQANSLQFASKMGCDVVAFSSTEDKDNDAHSFGAGACYSVQSLKNVMKPPMLDFLRFTTPVQPDWNVYLPLLAPKAKIFPLTIGPGNISFPAMPFLLKGITVQGSVVASRITIERMLAFAARHEIKPQVQRFPMDREGIGQAFVVLKEGRMRFRGVLIVPDDKKLA